MVDELERAIRQRDLGLLAEPRSRGVQPRKPGLLDLPGGVTERLALLNQFLNPVEAIGQSMRAGERMMSPNMGGYDRLAALGDMLSGVAGVAGPAVAAGRAGAPAAAAVMEGLLGGSPTQQAAGDTMRAAGRDIVDRLNQPGPVPVMYSNPIPGVGRGEAIDDALRAKYPGAKVSVTGDASKGYTLNRIDVPKSQRNSGIGTQIMRDLVDAVDAQGATLKLSPSGDFGGSVPRLKEFYKRFGFIENKGKAKDFGISESMYRLPQSSPAPTLPAPRTDAEAMARDIIQLRAEGRAAQVTDDMMAAADPQYMYSNTPLPMDYASRMARAEARGFGTDQPLYRGDANPNMQAFNTGQFAREGIGVTASDSPSVASTYMTGNNPAIYPLYARSENPLMVDVGGRNWTGIPAEAGTNYGRLNEVLPPENYLDEDSLFDLLQGSRIDWGDGTSSSLAMANTDNVSRAAQAGGFDQVQFQNIVDRGGAGKYYTSAVNEPRTTVMTADPANIRSRFARFDPAFAHLRNLSAALAAGVPIGLLSMQPNEEQY
jgi:GNAT superfamily N-acetyltransferase